MYGNITNSAASVSCMLSDSPNESPVATSTAAVGVAMYSSTISCRSVAEVAPCATHTGQEVFLTASHFCTWAPRASQSLRRPVKMTIFPPA
ncbi:MAG: hypothetical protein EBS48_11260, partial [Actinobacteria bacterium]|nr:hypothetical protein [Actinomycetota bacterium]